MPGTLASVDGAVKDWVRHCGESGKDAGKYVKDTYELIVCGYDPGDVVTRGIIEVLAMEVGWRKGKYAKAGWAVLGKLRTQGDATRLFLSFLTLSMVAGDSLTTKCALAAFAESASRDKGVVMLELCEVLKTIVAGGYEGDISSGLEAGLGVTKEVKIKTNESIVRGGVYALGMTIWGPDRVEGCRWIWTDVLKVFEEIVEFRGNPMGGGAGGEIRDKEKDRKAIKIAEVASLSLGMTPPPRCCWNP